MSLICQGPRECHILVGMNRRALLKSAVSAAGLSAAGRQVAHAAIPKMKITRVRVYSPERANPLFNQSDLVVTIETDAGITGIGEGGARDTLEQSAGRLIGQDPQYIERLWQDMTRSFFYPPGREKIDAIGALDLALWDIKGKVLGRPVHALLGGMARNHLRVLPDGRSDSGHTTRHERGGACARHDGSRISRVPFGRGGLAGQRPVQYARAVEQDGRGVVRRRARESARTATGASISTSASTCRRRFAAAT